MSHVGQLCGVSMGLLSSDIPASSPASNVSPPKDSVVMLRSDPDPSSKLMLRFLSRQVDLVGVFVDGGSVEDPAMFSEREIGDKLEGWF